MPKVTVSGGGRCCGRGGGALGNGIPAPVEDTPQGPHVGHRAAWPGRGALRPCRCPDSRNASDQCPLGQGARPAAFCCDIPHRPRQRRRDGARHRRPESSADRTEAAPQRQGAAVRHGFRARVKVLLGDSTCLSSAQRILFPKTTNLGKHENTIPPFFS